MSKKGTCVNCEEPDTTIVGKGLCGTCYNASRSDNPEKALAEVRKRRQEARESGSSLSGKKSKKRQPKPKGRMIGADKDDIKYAEPDIDLHVIVRGNIPGIKGIFEKIVAFMKA